MTLIGNTDLAEVCRMNENLTSKASHRIFGKRVPVGLVSNPSASPGQNDGFSDGFLTKRRVDACHSGQPGKSSDPKNPMKSRDYPPRKGSPAHPPFLATSQDFSRLPAGFGSSITRRNRCWCEKSSGVSPRSLTNRLTGDRVRRRVRPWPDRCVSSIPGRFIM